MVGIISSSTLGLTDSSLDKLGLNQGQVDLGQAKGNAYVNLATGNLAIQFIDETMSATGADLLALRTYNSMGALSDGDADAWRWASEKRIDLLTGTKGVSGTVRRTSGDGSETVFTWNATSAAYLATGGEGAHDLIKWNATTSEWEFRADGSSVGVEYYNGSTGWISRLLDSSGNRIDYTFSGNKITKIADSLSGQTVEFIYGTSGNGNGRVVGINTRLTAIGAQTRQVNYDYDTVGRLVSVKTDLSEDNVSSDNNVYTTQYTYQNATSFRIASVTQSDGTSVSFTYDASNRVSTVSDQTGITTFTYSTNSTSIKNGENQTWTYTFDANKQLTNISAPSVGGVINSTSYSYDASGNVQTVTDGKGKVVTYTYDSNGNRTKEVDSLGNTITRTFSTTNQRITETRYSVPSATSPSGAETTRYVYDTSDRLIFTISAEGNVSELAYNSYGLVSSTIQYAGKSYDVTGLAQTASISASEMATWKSGLTAAQKSQIQLTQLTYDTKGNLNKKTEYATVNTSGVGVLDDAAVVTEYVYSEHGQLLQTIAARGTGRATKTTLTSSVYDGLGRITSNINSGSTTTTAYSGVNITVTNSASGLSIVSTTDALGRLISLTQNGDSTSRVTKYVYDNAGRLRMTEDPSGTRNFVFYDAAGNISARVNAAGAAIVYTYDANGRVLTETRHANVATTTSWYSAATNTVTVASLTVGTTGSHVIADAAKDRKTTYTYDDAGRLSTTSVTGGLAVSTNQYDGGSRLVKTTQSSRVSEYFYDKNNRQIGFLDAEKYLTENIYDSMGRLIQVKRFATKVTTVSTFATMRTAVSAGESLSSYNFYDANGRLVGTVNEQGFLTEIIYDEANNKRQSLQYMTAVTPVAGSSLQSLKSVAGSAQTTTTVFDQYGRVSTVTQHDGTVTRHVYDTAGRLIRVINADTTSDQRGVYTRYNAFSEVTGALSGVGEATLAASPTVAAVNTAISSYGTTYQYDGAGRKISELGAVESGKPQTKTFYFYNAAGQISYVVNALGEVSKTLYNAFGQTESIRIFTNRISSANMATITQGGSDSLITGKIVVDDLTDSEIKTQFNQLGLVAKVIDAEDYETTNAYDVYGQLQYATKTISAGVTQRTRMDYDLLGRDIEQYADYDGINAQSSKRYDGYGRIIQSIDANRNAINVAYSNNGRVVTVTDSLNNTRKTEVDAFGRVVKSFDSYNNATTYSYDDANRSFTVISPDNTQITTTKTRTGETLQVKDAKNNLLKYTYTKDGKLDTITDGSNVKILDNEYDKSGRLYESVDGNGVVTRYTYDAANRVTLKQIDPTGLNIRTAYVFDGQGRQISITEASGTSESRETVYVYDQNSRVKQIIVDPNGLKLSTLFTYDGLGNRLTVEKGTTSATSQQSITYTFDRLGRKTKEVVNGLNITTQYFYDKNGNLTRVIDPNNNSSWFIYNANGQRTHVIDAMGGVTVSEYNKNGKVFHVRQYSTALTASVLTGLATNNNPSSVSLPAVSTSDRRTYSVYDNSGRLVYSLQAKDASNWVVAETRYDANGNVVSLIAYDKTISETIINTITASGSSENGVITLDEVAAQLTALGYTSTNLGNARVTSYEYDNNNRQTKTTLTGWYDIGDGKVYSTQAGQTDRFQRTIEVGYDAAGNTISNKIKTGTGTADYIYQFKIYDKAGRELYDIDGLGNVTGKTYDSLSNLKSLTRYATGVEIKTSGYWTESTLVATAALAGAKRSINFTYDKAGREQTVTQATGGVTTKYYDAIGNVIRISQQLTSSVNADSYFYFDSANRLTMKVDAENYGTKTEYDAAGNVKKVTEYANKFGGTLSTASVPTFTTSNKDRITQYNYNAQGKVTDTYRALFDNTTTLEKVTHADYNLFGDISQSTDIQNNVTQINYDRLGQQVQIVEPTRMVAGTGVDIFLNQVNATPITEITYNAFGESTQEVRRTSGGVGATITVVHELDAAGNEIRTQDGMGNSTYTSYNVSGKVIKQKQDISVADAHTATNYTHSIERRFEYDNAGRQTASIEVFGNQQSGLVSIYNGYGEILEERKVWGSATSSVASLLASTVNNVLITNYDYNTNGQLNYKHGTDGFVFYTFDLADRVLTITQREALTASSTDRITENIYDKLGRVVTRKLPQSNVTTSFGSATTSLVVPVINLGYDRWGNTITESGDTVAITRTFNQDNQVLTQTSAIVDRISTSGVKSATKVERKFNYDNLGRVLTEVQTAFEGSTTTQVNSRTLVTNTYNSAGQITRTLDATNVAQDFVYDAHGNRVGVRDALGHVTKFAFNANNQMTTKHLLRVGTTGEYTGSGTATAILLNSYKYDQAGRKYAEGDALGNFDYYRYDERNNIVTQRSRAGGEKVFEFDEMGNKTAEKLQVTTVYDINTDPYGSPIWQSSTSTTTLHSWSYKNSAGTDFVDYQSGLMQKRQVAADSNQIYTYEYSNRGQLLREKRSGTTVVTYDYWENGLQKSIAESNTVGYTTTSNTSNFYYDVRGNRTVDYSKTVSSEAAHTEIGYGGTSYSVSASSSDTGSFYTYYGYDAQNRLAQVKSPNTTIKIGSSSYATTNLSLLTYDYDEWGNRRRIQATYGVATAPNKTEWYSYDNADRVLNEAGKEYAYDGAGRRVKEFVSQTTKEYRGGTYGDVYLGSSTIRKDKIFSYNDLGLISQINMQTVETGYQNSSSNLVEETNQYDNRGFKTKSILQSKDRTIDNSYNADGTLLNSTTKVTSTGRKESYIVNRYNSSGDMSSYTYYAYDINRTDNRENFHNDYGYSYVNTYAGRQVGSISVTSSQGGTAKGTTQNSYDARGRLIVARITEQHVSNTSQTGFSSRYFSYNAAGQIIGRFEQQFGATTFKVQNYYYSPTGGELANLGDLGQNISPLSAIASGSNTPGTYTVNAGDTLMGIASILFGDAKLWYLIADANGLTMGPTDAFAAGDVGRNLRIPNNDKNVSNTSVNWKPYNPTEIIGDLTPNPTILPPPKKKGCGIVAMIIMVVVAVVLTVVTAGAAAMLMAGQAVTMAGAWAAGTAVMAGGAIAGTVAAGSMAAALGTVGTAMVASAIGGFVGSLGSQIVGKGMGVVDHISLRQAAGSGLTAGFAAGAGAYFQGAKAASIFKNGDKLSNIGNMARGATSYLGSVAANKIAGLEVSFNWTDLAVASVSSGITGKTGDKISDVLDGVGKGFVSNFANNMWGATVSSSLSRLAGRGGKQNWGEIAADAFGNALASSVIDKMTQPKQIASEEIVAVGATSSNSTTGSSQTALNGPGLTQDELDFWNNQENNPSIIKVISLPAAEEKLADIQSDAKAEIAKKQSKVDAASKKLDEIKSDPDSSPKKIASMEKKLEKVKQAFDEVSQKQNEKINSQLNKVTLLKANMSKALAIHEKVVNWAVGQSVTINVRSVDAKGKEIVTPTQYKIQGPGAEFGSTQEAAKDGIAFAFAVQKALGDNYERAATINSTSSGKYSYGKLLVGIPRLDKNYYTRYGDRTSTLIESGTPAVVGLADPQMVGMFHIHPKGEPHDINFSPGDEATYKRFVESYKKSGVLKQSFLGGNDGSFDAYRMKTNGKGIEWYQIEKPGYFDAY